MFFETLVVVALGATPLLDPGSQQTVEFEANHPLEAITGISHSVEAAFEQLPDGTLRAQLRAPLQTFSTGRSALDGRILEALGADRYPLVEVRVVVAADSRSAAARTDGGPVQAWVKLTLHGVSRTLRVPVDVTSRGGDQLKLTGNFSFELEDFGVPRPIFFLLPVAATVRIRFDLVSVAHPSFGAPGLLVGSRLGSSLAAASPSGR